MSKSFQSSQRLRSLPPYLFQRINTLKAKAISEGKDVIDLGMGNPDLPTAPHIVKRLVETVEKIPATHRYPQAIGSLAFREAACAWYQKRFGVRLDPEKECVSLVGSKEGIAHLSMAALDPGDTALVCQPCYPVHFNGVYLAGGLVSPVALEAKNGYLPDLGKIPEKVARRAKLFFLNYPNNPTASVVPDKKFLEEVARWAKRYGVIAVYDNAYSEITFDGYWAPSFLEVEGAKGVGVEFHSCSKTYNMAGWRVGFAVGNAKVISALEKFKSFLDYGVFTAIQHAAIEALSGPQDCVWQTVKIYQKRRDLMVDGLGAMGWKAPAPKATMYLWAPLPERFRKAGSVKFCEDLLHKTGVALSPGSGFGKEGEGSVRFALVASEERLREALSRIGQFLGAPKRLAKMPAIA